MLTYRKCDRPAWRWRSFTNKDWLWPGIDLYIPLLAVVYAEQFVLLPLPLFLDADLKQGDVRVEPKRRPHVLEEDDPPHVRCSKRVCACC